MSLVPSPTRALAIDQSGVAQRLMQKKQIDGSYTPAEWLSVLSGVAEVDRRGDKLRGRLLVALILYFFFGIGLSIFLAVAGLGLAVPVIVAGGVALIIWTVVAHKKDLPNQFRLFAVPMLSILRQEMAATSPLYLRLDLRGRTFGEKKTHVDKATKTRFFTDPWMNGKARLLDESALEWRLVDYTAARSVTKKGASGKYKTKTKTRVKTLIEVVLRVRSKDYVAVRPAGAGQGAGKMAIKSGDRHSVIRVRKVIKSKDAGVVLPVKDFVDAIAQAYQRIAPQPKEARRS